MARNRGHGLLVRLLAGSVLVAICSITATAWLAATSTSGTIRQEQGETLASDARINDELLGYAATHRTWDGVAPLVRELARGTGRRIALTTEPRRVIADSAEPGSPLPARPSAVVDPLAVDVTLVPSAAADRIDRRATGPFTLTAAERARSRAAAGRVVACARERYGVAGRVTVAPGGRASAVLSPVPAATPSAPAGDPRAAPTPMPAPPGTPGELPLGVEEACGADELREPVATERRALRELQTRVTACLRRSGLSPVILRPDLTWTARPSRTPATERQVAACLAEERRAQLRPYVAPPAVLFIGTPEQAAGLELGPGGTLRITGAAALVLVLAVGVSALIATRLTRPVHALTGAVRRMREGDATARVDVRDRGEIGQLAAAFNEMAEHLDRMERQRREMVSDVSHELRTPISNVRGWLEAAQDGVAELDRELVASLVEETLLLQHIVDDLQELALADAGKLRLHPEPVAVADLLDQVATVHRGRAAAAGLTLLTEAPGDPVLLADPVRLRQAVGNLVVNALRHTGPGGRVTLRARATPSGVDIEVADTGTGIAPEHLPHVFDRFWRADKSRSRRTGGSGLGLAIVRHLAELHGGRASVTSVPGAGATFTLSLPHAPPGHAPVTARP
ncbi:sensor histidine kinase [Bailinhaonella thermotolerans]|uniref:histidine kinase n=1 Tax=Bailinhaonella thermotolerans TaxID=1070861 RepID=A0A3A4B995_9ACTN|nr:ATP-binding protein [Bailinhaonella thermotolerans]RJL34274.1 HAMP domain-containing protein [Bailinhaonella thermotolerans]